MNLSDELERGAKAEKILNDPIFIEAFETVTKTIHDRWEECPVRDHEGAHELKLMLKLLGEVRAVLESTLADGKAAAAELKRMQDKVLSPAQWRKQWS